MQAHPLTTIAQAAKTTGVNRTSISRCLKSFAGLGIVSELTGKHRYRIFAYEQYIKILSEGTEPLSAYGRRYANLVDMAWAAEQKIDDGGETFTRAVAEGFFHLMAYKDEYEIARLLTDDSFMQQIHAQFSGNFKIKHHLAPPLFTRRDRKTGKIRKIAFGIWIRPVLRLLARFKFLRGTLLDVFGYTRERRAERARIVEYEQMIGEICSSLMPGKLSTATEIAALASTIRGYGHVKEQNVEKAAIRLAQLRNSITIE